MRPSRGHAQKIYRGDAHDYDSRDDGDNGYLYIKFHAGSITDREGFGKMGFLILIAWVLCGFVRVCRGGRGSRMVLWVLVYFVFFVIFLHFCVFFG